MIRLVSWLRGSCSAKRQDGMRQRLRKRNDGPVNMISNEKRERETEGKKCINLKIALKSTSPTPSIAESESDPLLPPYSPEIFITETKISVIRPANGGIQRNLCLLNQSSINLRAGELFFNGLVVFKLGFLAGSVP